jgi:hypothetical protein
MQGLIGPVLTFIGGIAATLIANFIAEDYRRHRDGSALASALAGELGSYKIAIAGLKDNLKILIDHAAAGRANLLPEMAMPTDPVFDKTVEKLGLLGTELPESVALAYGRIRGFRTMYALIASGKVGKDAENLKRLYERLLDLVIDAEAQGLDAISQLKIRMHAPFTSGLLTPSSWIQLPG